MVHQKWVKGDQFVKNIFRYRTQVIEAAEAHHIKYVEIPPKEMNQIRQRVLEKFVAPEGRKKLFFWEDLLPPVSRFIMKMAGDG
ncbi:hypothetical protein HMPREF9374_2744 [Desmospora sp. 8437]|nr:hypothetical protein HMPREF9374_2744 [Desmospora sp. 8437]